MGLILDFLLIPTRLFQLLIPYHKVYRRLIRQLTEECRQSCYRRPTIAIIAAKAKSSTRQAQRH
jgi:hypothetical protein